MNNMSHLMFKVSSVLEQAGKELIAMEDAPDYYQKLLEDGRHVEEMKKIFKSWKEFAEGDDLEEIDDVLYDWENSELPRKMDKIVSLAKKVYDKGNDLYGHGYITQTAPIELNTFIEAKFRDLSKLASALDKLEKWADRALITLKRESTN